MNFFVDLLDQEFSIGDFHIRYYAIFILLGALMAYAITKIETKKNGKDSSSIEMLFFVSLLAGIIGARAWYVICQWNSEFLPAFNNGQDIGGGLLNMIAIWNGGLAVEGGVFLGIAVGLIHVHLHISDIKPFEILDYVAPSILLAQAVGRIGNFINIEVYGKCVSVSKYSWLPDWVLNQFIYKTESGTLLCSTESEMVTPLCMWESVFTFAGFIILFFLGYKLLTKKKILPVGFVSGCYFVWYGTLRVIMEPMRAKEYIMDNNISVYASIAYICLGAFIILMSIIFGVKKKRKLAASANLIKEVTYEADELSGERVLTRAEVGITKYITPEKYKAHDFEGVESDLLSEEDKEKAKELAKEDDEVVKDFIVIKGPELPEEEVVINQEETVATDNDDIAVAEEEEEPAEHRVIEIEEGDVPDLSHINKFVEKNAEVEESILEGYRTEYNPDVQKNVAEEENEEVTSTITDEELAKKEEVPTSETGEPLIEFKNGFGSSEYVDPRKGQEEQSQEDDKNVVEIEEGDVPELSKINKFYAKDKETEDSIIEGYRTEYNPDIEKNVTEEENNEVASTLDVELEEGEKIPEIGEISLDFKSMPAPERSGGIVEPSEEETAPEETNEEKPLTEETAEETPEEENLSEEPSAEIPEEASKENAPEEIPEELPEEPAEAKEESAPVLEEAVPAEEEPSEEAPQTENEETPVSENIPLEEPLSEETPEEASVSEEAIAEEPVSEDIPEEETQDEIPSEETAEAEEPSEDDLEEETPSEEETEEAVPAEEEPVQEEVSEESAEEDEEVSNPFGKQPLPAQEEPSLAYNDEEEETPAEESSGFSWGSMGTFSKENENEEEEENDSSSFSWSTPKSDAPIEETPAEEETPEEEIPSFTQNAEEGTTEMESAPSEEPEEEKSASSKAKAPRKEKKVVKKEKAEGDKEEGPKFLFKKKK